MKNIGKRLFAVVVVSLVAVFGAFAAESYASLLAKGKEYEKKGQYVHALGNYWDAMAVEPTGKAIEAYNAYQDLWQEINSGCPDWNGLDEFDLYDKWYALCCDFEQYWTEYCPNKFHFSNVKKGSLDMETRTASYYVSIEVGETEKYLDISESVINGLSLRWKKDWKGIPADWPKTSVMSSGSSDFNNGVALVRMSSKASNGQGNINMPAALFYIRNIEYEYRTVRVNVGEFDENGNYLISQMKRIPTGRKNSAFRSLYDVKFNITDTKGNVLLTSGRKLMGSDGNYEFKGVPQSTMKILDSMEYRIIPTGIWLEYGSPSATYRTDSRDWLKSMPEIKLDMDKVVFSGFRVVSEASRIDNPLTEIALANDVDCGEFYMTKTEVTDVLAYSRPGSVPQVCLAVTTMPDMLFSRRDRKNLPIIVTFYDAVEFCNEMSQRQGLRPCYSGFSSKYKNEADIECDFSANGWRLPTKEEWEYAAREGDKDSQYKYSGSDNIDEVAWYDGNSDGHLHSVASKKPNALGLYDMSGNAAEWCWDRDEYQSWHTDDFDYRRMGCGGSYNDRSVSCSVSECYSWLSVWHTEERIGFRMVRNNEEGIARKQQEAKLRAEEERRRAEEERRRAEAERQRAEEEERRAEEERMKAAQAEEEERERYAAELNALLENKELPAFDVVTVKGGPFNFYMLKTELTQLQYASVTGGNPSNFQAAYKPVEMVGWLDAVKYCNCLSEQQGLKPCYSINGNTDTSEWNALSVNDIQCNMKADGWRLPTVAEWEYAARGGEENSRYKYSGSDNVDEVAWHSGNSNDKTHDVAGKKPNALGLYDMSGNVYEWCWDKISETDRIVCGGSFAYDGSFCAVSGQLCLKFHSKSSSWGFRPVRSAKSDKTTAEKSGKADKASKSDKSSKADKSKKSDKSDKSSKSSKSDSKKDRKGKNKR